ncbi:hypothetical protein [Candidatus Venteria ishoeyi]|nr:hypothetical protein [Candidatus Venteria ishoeyi]
MDEIDEYIKKWSNGTEGVDQELHEYLGMTWKEYSIWGTKPSILSVILRSRNAGISLDEELNAERHALAARAENADEAEEIKLWLKRIGKI